MLITYRIQLIFFYLFFFLLLFFIGFMIPANGPRAALVNILNDVWTIMDRGTTFRK